MEFWYYLFDVIIHFRTLVEYLAYFYVFIESLYSTIKFSFSFLLWYKHLKRPRNMNMRNMNLDLNSKRYQQRFLKYSINWRTFPFLIYEYYAIKKFSISRESFFKPQWHFDIVNIVPLELERENMNDDSIQCEKIQYMNFS